MSIYYTDNTREEWRKNIPIDWREDYTTTPQKCLHESCPECNGTGTKKNGLGMCVHMISCPCPKCSPR